MLESFALKLFLALGKYLFDWSLEEGKEYISELIALKEAKKKSDKYKEEVAKPGSREDRKKAEDEFLS